ncbi:CRE-XOL-1 protein [Caenorhabditis remanei]|uniref:CRE-XOL-1 protein n=1 Tax=Caenorhabditis remanei TaxID=31234 RepID=E3LC90_CAERE|nr:CRE-XOL-1 protein [Caenorhabditis remanei]
MNDRLEVKHVQKRVAYSSLENINGKRSDENTGIGIAPHVVQLAGCTYLAVTKSCIAKAIVLHDREPVNVNEHQFLIGMDKRITPYSEFFYPLLNMLELKKRVYKIWINDQRDHNQQESIYTTYSMLAAIWKSLSYFERGNVYQESKDSIWRIENFAKRLNEFETGIDRKEAIISAVLCGTSFSLQVPNFPVPCAEFYHNYDLVFVASIYHYLRATRCDNFEPNPILSDSQQLHARVVDFEKSIWMESNNRTPTGAMASLMKKTSAERILSEKNNETYYELDSECEQAMIDFDKENPGKIKGWEVQRGGILLALQKGDIQRNNDDFLVLIAVSTLLKNTTTMIKIPVKIQKKSTLPMSNFKTSAPIFFRRFNNFSTK